MRSLEIVRCAIYTRKSTDRGLDMNVTSLETQRGVCQAYIKCHAHRNWTELPDLYDDGGYSGGTLERPALKRLISDIEAGRVDVIVIYKIDRLTRSLLDFVRLIEVLNKYEVSFVSVTQSFDTSDSMGRLILNILLTFAQFEREIMSDRVRDKKAAMMRKGYFAGASPPFGYAVDSGGRLCLDDERAAIVREIFRRYPGEESVKALADDLRRRGCLTRSFVSKAGNRHGGQVITTAQVRHILENPIYTGHIVHRGEWIEAEIDPLVTREAWEKIQEERKKRAAKKVPERDFLTNILYDEQGRHMRVLKSGPGRTNPFRYYRSEAAGWSRRTEHKGILVHADQVESLVRISLSSFLRNRPELNAAVLSQGHYSGEISKLLLKGNQAARRLECMAPIEFREALMALTPRIEVTSSQLRLHIACPDLVRFLGWDGAGRFCRSTAQPSQASRIYTLVTSAGLVRGHHRYMLPVEPREAEAATLQPHLARLVMEAARARAAMFAQRDKSLLELATKRRMTQSHFVRLLRVNYLAPDIQTALLDGTQPEGLTQYKVLNAAMLLDWDQQREMLGFRSPNQS